jgi:hypothetical protein
MKGVKRALEDSCRLHENGSWGIGGLPGGFAGWSLERFPFEGFGLTDLCFSFQTPIRASEFK